MCFHIIRNARIENVGKYGSCMFSKLRMIWKQTGESQLRAAWAELDVLLHLPVHPNLVQCYGGYVAPPPGAFPYNR